MAASGQAGLSSCTRVLKAVHEVGSRSSPEFERVADYSRPECKRVGCCSAQWLSCELFKRRATDSWVRDRAGQPPPRRMCASTMLLRSVRCGESPGVAPLSGPLMSDPPRSIRDRSSILF